MEFIRGLFDKSQLNFTRINNSSISFIFTTRNTNFSYVDVNNLHNLSIIRGNPFKVIIHGRNDLWSEGFAMSTIQEYRKTNFNIIAVDWDFISSLDIIEVCNLSLEVGIAIGSFIIELSTTFDIPYEEFHLIGYSVGSHIAGLAGKYVKNMTGLSIGRITGADPSRTLFINSPTYSRLDKTDALFVDVIHTDMSNVGIDYIAGHVDFYPNNGKAPQPHCGSIFSFITQYFSK